MSERQFRKSFLLFYCLLIMACSSETASINRIPFKIYSDNEINVASYHFDQFKEFLTIPNDSIYVLNFWATWCAPCVAELPYFEQANQTFKDQKIRFIYVSLDFEKQIEQKLLPFLKKNKLEGEVLVLKQEGMNKWIDAIDANWSGNLPATMVLNKTTKDFYPHSMSYQELEKAIIKRLP